MGRPRGNVWKPNKSNHHNNETQIRNEGPFRVPVPPATCSHRASSTSWNWNRNQFHNWYVLQEPGLEVLPANLHRPSELTHRSPTTTPKPHRSPTLTEKTCVFCVEGRRFWTSRRHCLRNLKNRSAGASGIGTMHVCWRTKSNKPNTPKFKYLTRFSLVA